MPLTMTRCDRTPAWQRLTEHSKAFRSFDLRTAFAQDAGRFSALSQTAPQVFADLSKQHWDTTAHALLLQLAEECGLGERRDAMFAGQAINTTEGRRVLHTVLRAPCESNRPVAPLDNQKSASDFVANAEAEAHAVLTDMLAYAEAVRADSAITDVVNIGIGGSDLGPCMATQALAAYGSPGRRLHFVANVDGHELARVLVGLRPANTLFLIASKSFTTAETMTNAESAKRWFLTQGGGDVARHFAALTTNVAAARAFGIQRSFGFWDWVGGRFSLWSAIGLPVAVAIGAERFRGLLAGAHAMDEHFRSAPLASNLPVRLALLDVWYRNFLGYSSRCIAPYHAGLARLPAYLQQLEMESNGKRVDLSGTVLPFATVPVIWGEPGTNAQHAYFQMIHQGSEVVPVEFIAVKQPSHNLPGHHTRLLCNALAQSQALMLGQDDPRGHQHFPGNRPSAFFVLDALTPEALGAFIALSEHRVFCSGAIWGINSFDQWGVELGKLLAQSLERSWAGGQAVGLDASTAGLLARLTN